MRLGGNCFAVSYYYYCYHHHHHYIPYTSETDTLYLASSIAHISNPVVSPVDILFFLHPLYTISSSWVFPIDLQRLMLFYYQMHLSELKPLAIQLSHLLQHHITLLWSQLDLSVSPGDACLSPLEKLCSYSLTAALMSNQFTSPQMTATVFGATERCCPVQSTVSMDVYQHGYTCRKHGCLEGIHTELKPHCWMMHSHKIMSGALFLSYKNILS